MYDQRDLERDEQSWLENQTDANDPTYTDTDSVFELAERLNYSKRMRVLKQLYRSLHE